MLKITTPPTIDQLKEYINDKYGNDFHPDFLNEIIKKYLDSIPNHKEYSKKKCLKYISDNIFILDRIYRKQESLYWLKRGWTKEESEDKRIVRDKNYYINNFGEEGLKKYKEKNKKISDNCGHSLLKFITRYGEDGIEKWKKYKESCKRDLLFFQNKYGEKEGILRYNIFLENSVWKNGYTLKYCIKKYGKIKGLDIYSEYIKIITPSLENCIKRYGEIDGIIFYNTWRKKCLNFSQGSKESLIIFEQILKWLDGIIDRNDIYVGNGYSREWFIKDNNNFYLYDFTIKSLNIIIEYNGISWHANPEWELDRLKNWKHPFGETYETNILNFINKINIAKNKGFDVLLIWSDENFEESLEKCKNFILNKYEQINKFPTSSF